MKTSYRVQGSLHRQLTLMVVLTTGASLFLACLAFVAYDMSTLRAAMARDAATLARVVGLNSSAAITFDDRRAAAETLAGLEAADPVEAAVLYDRNGQEFARWLSPKAGPVALTEQPLEAGHRFRDGHLELAERIVFAGEQVGSLYLRWDTAELAARVERYVAIVLLLFGATAGVATVVISRLRRRISRPLAELAEGAEAVAAGDLSQRVDASAEGEIGLLARTFNDMALGLRALVGQVRHSMRDVTEVAGRLRESGAAMSDEAQRQKIAIDDSVQSLEQVGASIGEVNAHAERLAENARDTSTSITEMDVSLGEVASNMDHLGDSIDTTAAAASEVAANVESVVGAVGALRSATDGTAERLEQLSLSVGRVRANADESQVLSADSSQEASHGMTAVNETIVAMREISSNFARLETSVGRLSEKSQAIGDIIQVIQEVAEQTTLLSLNAAIIAAQAGEHGKAFSVVADQVKSLADRTHRSAGQIAELVRAVQEETSGAVEAVEHGAAKVENGVAQSNAAGEVLGRIIEKARNTSTRVEEIHSAAAGQTEDLGRLDEAVGSVRDMVEQIHRSAQEQQRATMEIAEAVDAIRKLGARVRTSTDEQRRSSRLITNSAADVAAMINQIAEATGSLAKSRSDIEHALQVVRDVTEGATDRTDELNEVVGTLAERSQQLEQEIGRFKTE